MSLTEVIYQGTSVTTSVVFANPSAPDTPVDPDSVVLKFRFGKGQTTTWTYLGTGSIVRVAEGNYSAELDSTGQGGLPATVQWIGTGACAAVGVATFNVTKGPLD